MKNTNRNGHDGVARRRCKPFIVLRQKCCDYYLRGICPMARKRSGKILHIPIFNSEEDFIVIPREVRDWKFSRYAISMRLRNLLCEHSFEELGDLHRHRLSDMAKWRGWGKMSLLELLALVKNLQQSHGDRHRRQADPDMEMGYEI
jgi:DNA-directed RNA polymerase alpha subunit